MSKLIWVYLAMLKRIARGIITPPLAKGGRGDLSILLKSPEFPFYQGGLENLPSFFEVRTGPLTQIEVLS
jgi:hypothetical protein